MPAHRRKVPLHLCISAMFTGVLLLVGAAMGYNSYRQATAIILSSSEQVFEGVQHDIQQDLASTFQPARQALGFLAVDERIGAARLDQRLALLPAFDQALRGAPRLASLYIGYANGDFFMVRALRNATQRTALQAPSQARLQVWSITHDAGKAVSESQFYDDQLKRLGQSGVSGRYYDPRERPWYQQARQQSGLISTAPYVFYSDRRVGTSLALEASLGPVVGADITLDELSANLARHRVTPSTQLALYDRLGNAIAYPDSQRLIIERGTAQLQRLSQLHPAFAAFMAEPSASRIHLDGRDWIVASHDLAEAGDEGLRLAVLVPEDELLAQAFKMRWEGALITLMALLLCLPLGWLCARLVVKPLRDVARDVTHLAAGEAPGLQHRGDPVVMEVHLLHRAVGRLANSLSEQRQAQARITATPGKARWAQWLAEAVNCTQANAAVLYQHAPEHTCLLPVAACVGAQPIPAAALGLAPVPLASAAPWMQAGPLTGWGFEALTALQPLLLAQRWPRVYVLNLPLPEAGAHLLLLWPDTGEPPAASAHSALSQLLALATLMGPVPAAALQ